MMIIMTMIKRKEVVKNPPPKRRKKKERRLQRSRLSLRKRPVARVHRCSSSLFPSASFYRKRGPYYKCDKTYFIVKRISMSYLSSSLFGHDEISVYIVLLRANKNIFI